MGKMTAAKGGSGGTVEDQSKVLLHGLVSLSFVLHFFLVILGYVIKDKKGSTWVSMSVHGGFFVGDLVATTALTTLFKLQLQGKIHTVEVFWVPFLLLHLGSVETIAARVMSEEELWRTYTLGLLIVYGLSIYFTLKFDLGKRNKTLTGMDVILLVLVVLKCAERLWILSFSGLSFMMFVPVFADIDISIYKELSDVFSLNESMSAEKAFRMVAMELDFDGTGFLVRCSLHQDYHLSHTTGPLLSLTLLPVFLSSIDCFLHRI